MHAVGLYMAPDHPILSPLGEEISELFKLVAPLNAQISAQLIAERPRLGDLRNRVEQVAARHRALWARFNDVMDEDDNIRYQVAMIELTNLQIAIGLAALNLADLVGKVDPVL